MDVAVLRSRVAVLYLAYVATIKNEQPPAHLGLSLRSPLVY